MQTKNVAIIGLVVLEVVAMITGTDGALLLPIAAIIAGLGGYELKGIRERKGHTEG